MRLPIVLDTCTILNLLRIDEDEFLYKKLIKLEINILRLLKEDLVHLNLIHGRILCNI